MTGGQVAILGPVGSNFGAGMTGGMAFVYDRDKDFEHRVNTDSVIYQRIEVGHYEATLRNLVTEHHKATGSAWAEGILVNWDREVRNFWQVVPKEMLDKLEVPVHRDALHAKNHEKSA
jgi:glutamate synthase (NADPH/NADH) large chain